MSWALFVIFFDEVAEWALVLVLAGLVVLLRDPSFYVRNSIGTRTPISFHAVTCLLLPASCLLFVVLLPSLAVSFHLITLWFVVVCRHSCTVLSSAHWYLLGSRTYTTFLSFSVLT